MPGLIGADPGLPEDSGVVVDDALCNDHIADVELGVETPGHSGQNDDATAEALHEEGDCDGGVDLADPRLGNDHLEAVEYARRCRPSGQVKSFGSDQGGAHLLQLGRNRRERATGADTPEAMSNEPNDVHTWGEIDYIPPWGSLDRGTGGCMPEWIGSMMFLAAVGLSGSKISDDFGNRGLRGYAMLMLVLCVYAAGVSVAFA